MKPGTAPFLTAEWRQLAMVNYAIEPAVLRPLLPAGTELDDWQGTTFVSVVGFLFLDTRVLGVPIPFHGNFEEVNLRFYVRRKGPEGWRRAVVFVKEIVPRRAIAWVARTLYGENYVALPMEHNISAEDAGARSVSYSWRRRGVQNRVEVHVLGVPAPPAEGSAAEFITEHYWGYARRRGGRTSEYHVEHPPWSVVAAERATLDCDVAGIYGEQFVDALQTPASAFLATGSEVAVSRAGSLPAG